MTLIPFQLLFTSLLVAVSPTHGDFQEIPYHLKFQCFEEYASPSGKFRLSVRTNPERREKRYGPADYCLTQEGETVWCSALPYRLCPAAVFDDGTVVGTATQRRTGPRPPRTFFHTFFHVVIIDPSGSVVLNEVTKKARRVHSEASPTPSLRAMFVDFKKRRLWLKLLDRRGKRSLQRHRVLRVYDVDTGRKLSDVNPSQLCSNADHAHHQLDICRAHPVPGTDLMFAHAIAYDEKYKTRDGVFAVIDAQGKLIWQDELTDDYALPAGGRRYDSCLVFLGKPPVFGAGDAPGSFWIRSIHDEARIEFKVTKDQAAEKWSVQKLSE